jgi:transposase
MDSLCLDVSKNELIAMLIDAEGRLLHARPHAFTQSPAGYSRLLAWMRDPAHTRIVFEATGVYTRRLVQAMVGVVASIHQLNPRMIKNFATSMTQTKTDHADVRAIAEAVHTLALRKPEVLDQSRIIVDPQRDNLTLWLQEHDRLRRNIARLKNQIANVTLETAPDAPRILERRHAELDRLRAEQREVRREIEQIFRAWRSRDAQLACSINGVGTLTAASILTAIHSIEQFDSVDAFKAYFGMYPRRRQSGPKETSSRMATHGNALVRHNLWNAARSAVMCNAVCRDYFERLRDNGKHAAAAYGAVARKLLQIIYGVLKSRTTFRIPSPAT